VNTVWNNFPALDTSFHGTDITLNKRMSSRWSMTSGASFGHTVGDIYATLSTVDLNNPNNTFRRGVLTYDVPWSYRLSGVYALPYQTSVSATGQYYNGFPQQTTVSVGNNTVALTQGTQTLVVAPSGTTRLPPVKSLDVSLRKFWQVSGVKLEPRVDLYNLLNAASILGQVTQLGPAYGRVSSIQRGRLIKLGVNVEF
jgi:hypothetical protein